MCSSEFFLPQAVIPNGRRVVKVNVRWSFWMIIGDEIYEVNSVDEANSTYTLFVSIQLYSPFRSGGKWTRALGAILFVVVYS